MSTISVIIITYNEEHNIERCLRSVQWADEIIVVDSFSTDRTVEIANRFTKDVIQHQYEGDILQREYGFTKATSDWLLWIDADEEVTGDLQHEIQTVIRLPDAKDGYFIARKVFVFDKWIEYGGWFPDWQFRLARRTKQIPQYQEVHGGFTTHGPKGNLKGYLHHYTYADISEYLRKMNDHTSLHVSNKLKENPTPNIGWQKIVLSPLVYFFKMYIIKKGYRDGMHGFLVAVYSALYTLLLYAKTWEYQWRLREGKGLLPPITNPEIHQLRRLS